MRIGVITSGGDAPGMNPCVASLIKGAKESGHEIVGFAKGFRGIAEGGAVTLSEREAAGIYKLGGTVLGAGRYDGMRDPDERRRIAEALEARGIEALIIIGGDGSFKGGLALTEVCRVTMVGIPATIDNNIYGSDYTLGYDTAMNKLVNYIDDITDTGLSHEGRVFLVETLGASNGYFAYGAYAMGIADMCVICEDPMGDDEVIEKIEMLYARSEKGHVIVTIAEDVGKTLVYHNRLKSLGYNSKMNLIGYQQRGGSPTARDRLHAAGFAKMALAACAEASGAAGKYVVFSGGEYSYLDFTEAANKKAFPYRT